jgi:hypothetical protein
MYLYVQVRLLFVVSEDVKVKTAKDSPKIPVLAPGLL